MTVRDTVMRLAVAPVDHVGAAGSRVSISPPRPTPVSAAPTPANLALAGILTSNVCFVAAIPLLVRLAAPRLGTEGARTTALLLCVVPFGFFFNAAYTESLFLLLILGAFSCAGRGWWWAAGAIAGLAAGTRLVGLALAPALLFMAWRRRAPLRKTRAAR